MEEKQLIITGAQGLTDSALGALTASNRLIALPETDLVLPPSAQIKTAAPPPKVLGAVATHPLVTAPVVFAGAPHPKSGRSLSERAKEVPGGNRAQRRRRAKALR